MTVTIVNARPDPKVIKGRWLRKQVDDLLAAADLDRNQLTRLINIERQFSAVDLDYLIRLRDWHDGKQSKPKTYDIE
jgi:hypothetical protein